MRGRLAFTGQVLTVLLVSVISTAAVTQRSEPAATAQRYIEKGTLAIEAGHHSLGRSYLDAVVLSPWISPRQRARAYYFRGFSFFSQHLYVSAAQDYARALEFNPSQGAALSALSHMYAEELGLTRDTAEAFRLALKAARGGHVRAKVYLGVALLHGRGVERDVRKARFWLQSAADDKYAPAYVHLALTYRNGFADEPEPEIALSWYARARDDGDSQATLAIAHMNLHNEFEQARLAEAVRLFRLLANDGSGHAQAMLAHMYLTAQGVEGDYEMSRGLYDKAAEQGIVSAFAGLGHIYENGLGVAADKHAARSWYTRGATCPRSGRVANRRGLSAKPNWTA